MLLQTDAFSLSGRPFKKAPTVEAAAQQCLRGVFFLPAVELARLVLLSLTQAATCLRLHQLFEEAVASERRSVVAKRSTLSLCL